jgi:3-hydroxyacyl-CoA dehydrogenase/enoyl-CoA hydratase/3-hydroxybutyryl-CoA epimerase
MGHSEYLRLEIEDGVALITLDAPSASVNTVSPAWLDEMTDVFARLEGDETVSGILITSAKAGFMAGADLNYILDHACGLTAREAFEFSQRATHMHRQIERCGKPVVAAMNGFALGGGYELALACCHRILVDDPKAVVGTPEVNVGLLPGSGGTQRLPRLIGLEPALEVLLEGRSYPPAKALALGLVDTVVPADQLIAAARAWLATAPDPVRPWDRKGYRAPGSDGLLKQSTASIFTLATGRLLARFGRNYPAPISILTCVFEGIQLPIDTALRVESRHFARLLVDPVSRNIIRTTFVNKGRAEKGARRPRNVPQARVKKLGILGAGMMGAGIAYVAAKVGIEVVLLDMSAEAAARGKAYSERILGKAVAAGKSTEEEASALLGRIAPTTDYDALAGVDLVIEAVFEDTAIKAEVTAKAERVIPETAIFASNTSTLPITQLAGAFSRPADFIGLHFFSPVERMGLVEVIKGRATGDEALARALDFVAQIRKTPILVNDSRGFYTSRVFQTFIHEGLELLRDGVAPALIENGAKLAGFPVGPLALLDEVSLELPMKIVRQTEAEDPSFRRPGSMAVMETLAEGLGRPGRKGGAGFYDYPADTPKHLWPGLAEHFPPVADQPDVEEVKRRLLYVQALETVRCLDENVLTHPADGDLGAVFGWGFPSWTGGTLSLIETVGVADFVRECDRLAQHHGARFAPTDQLREMAAAGRGFDY